MTMTNLIQIKDAPFLIGAQDRPRNPEGLPDTFAFQLGYNAELARLEQCDSPELEQVLSQAYAHGTLIGTPSDDTPEGQPYVTDFVEFIESRTDKRGGRLLEIGAGVGFLSALFKQKSWDVTSIEPGSGYADSWQKLGLEVINDFYPSQHVSGKFDLIIAYTVLEHILDTRSFLEQIARDLAPGGLLFLSVPDCSLEISLGDPSMLLHEHFQYFNKGALQRSLQQAGFGGEVSPSRYGRSLYACASPGAAISDPVDREQDARTCQEFAQKFGAAITGVQAALGRFDGDQELGVYCPGRAMFLLPTERTYRFFDDDPYLHHKFIPPFDAQIENFEEFKRNPPQAVLIMSRTFGDKIAAKLRAFCEAQHLDCDIVCISDLLS